MIGKRLPVLADNKLFVQRLGQGWQPMRREPSVVNGVAASTSAHRDQLSAEYPGVPLVVFGGEAMNRNDDVFFAFRADTNFLWLTGCSAEGSVLLMTPRAGGHDAVLFIPEPHRPGSAGFFADRNHGELWIGPTPGLREWADALGLTVRPLAEAAQAIAAVGDTVKVAGRPTALIMDLPAPSAQLLITLSELRLIKDQWEVEQLRAAVDASISGFAAVASELPTAIAGGGERWLQGTFDRHARTYGNGVGYASIVAAGSNASVLHWTRCDSPVFPEQLLLLDAGVETNSFYTADVTRTFPIGGTFSPEQRMVHDLVQRSHEAGLAAVRPGRVFSDFHYAAMEVLAEGLDDWGLLPVSVDEALTDSGQHHRRYLVCGIGHHLGLDVHDCSRAGHEEYQGGEMRAGMVLTVEPGLYFHENDLTVPPELRGIGVRIEDDVLVTSTGSDVLSDALPIDADGLEAWVAQSRR